MAAPRERQEIVNLSFHVLDNPSSRILIYRADDIEEEPTCKRAFEFYSRMFDDVILK